MNMERPIKVITGYDEVSFGDIKRRYPITNHEWRLNAAFTIATEYVHEGKGKRKPKRDPWGRIFRPWTCDDDAEVRYWDDHSFPGYKYTRWTTVEGVPIKLVTI